MPVMDEFREEREALKHGTPKEKFQYFMDYYKWYVIVGIIVICVICSIVHQVLTQKKPAFYACLLNSTTYDYPENAGYQAGLFEDRLGIDKDKFEVIFDTSIMTPDVAGANPNAAQKLVVYIAAAELDTIVTADEYLPDYAYQNDFKDLRDFLTPEQFETYKDFFYYIDGEVVKEVAEASSNLNLEYTPVYPDPRIPEAMSDPIPVAIYLPEDCALKKEYYFGEGDIVVSVLINTTRPEAAREFIDFLFEEQPAAQAENVG